MKRSMLSALLAAGTILLAALPASASPATVETFPVAGEVFTCGTTTYTLTSGEVVFVEHVEEAANGNLTFTVTVSPRRAKAVSSADPEASISIQGAFWVGGLEHNANTGGLAVTLTDKFQIVERGVGVVGTVNNVFHITIDGSGELHLQEFEFGDCVSPA